jgi:hypothetical protein
VRRAITAARVFGLVLMVVSGAAVQWLMTSESLAMRPPEIDGELRYTDTAAVLAAAGLDGTPNVVRVSTRTARQAILGFDSISDAHVRVALPDRVIVSVSERTPVFAVWHEGQNLLVDERGVVVASVADAEVVELGIPVVRDERREWALEIGLGKPVESTELAALLLLAALEPAELGSTASSLEIAVDDESGFVVTARPHGWRAVFGHYTPTLRPPDLIPRQVQCLRSLLAAGEESVRTAYLAPLDERCGTYVPVPTLRVSPTPEPSA